jgi:cellulase/cellobiase CelA1
MKTAKTALKAWPGGFQATVTVHNGSAPRAAWQVGWAFPNGQTITQLWNASYTQTGSSVTARNLGYNGSLAANATTTFGFTATWNGDNGAPTGLTCQ